LTPGNKTPPPHSYVFTLPSPDPMERMMGRDYDVQRDGVVPAIEVRPLPEGAPASFGGAVGSFQLDARLASTSLKAGDGTQLVVTIRGRGSFDNVSAPTLD